ncbi:MAG: hypothetical protein NZ903_02835 [Candidatus Micrarchaeota archaeon]|nr:hypothetical protein [Candidatus Micrarchaeota archaeon]
MSEGRMNKEKKSKTREKERMIGKSVATFDKKAMALSLEQGRKQPRIAFYSPFSAVLLNYLKNTKPRFSISEEVASIIEAELSRRYPLLASYIKRALSRKRL